VTEAAKYAEAADALDMQIAKLRWQIEDKAPT
jgi:hypothetical protein